MAGRVVILGSYTEVMRAQCPGGTIVRIAGDKSGTYSSALKIQKGGETYSVLLVDPTTDPANASCVRIKMPGVTNPQALRKCNSSDVAPACT